MSDNNEIVVSVKELLTMAKSIARAQMNYVAVRIDPPDDSSGDPLPACLSFSAVRKDRPDICYDFECIDAVDDSVFDFNAIQTTTNIIE